MGDLRNIQLYRRGLVHCSVCYPVNTPEEDILKKADLDFPTGLSHGWKFSDDKMFSGGELNPCSCNLRPETYEHRLLVC